MLEGLDRIDWHRLTVTPQTKNALVVRVQHDTENGIIAASLRLDTPSRHSFVHVPIAGSRYVAQLGYHDSRGHWVVITTSQPVMTPRETVSPEKSIQFAAMPSTPSRQTMEKTGQAPESLFPAITSKSPLARETSIVPPRVGWIPSLGIEPDAEMGQSAEQPQLLEAFAAAHPDRQEHSQ